MVNFKASACLLIVFCYKKKTLYKFDKTIKETKILLQYLFYFLLIGTVYNTKISQYLFRRNCI